MRTEQAKQGTDFALCPLPCPLTGLCPGASRPSPQGTSRVARHARKIRAESSHRKPATPVRQSSRPPLFWKSSLAGAAGRDAISGRECSSLLSSVRSKVCRAQQKRPFLFSEGMAAEDFWSLLSLRQPGGPTQRDPWLCAPRLPGVYPFEDSCFTPHIGQAWAAL